MIPTLMISILFMYMGKIRQKYIKSIGDRLLKEHSEFKIDWEENKRLISEYAGIKSKNVRNRVAGYITHELKKSKT